MTDFDAQVSESLQQSQAQIEANRGKVIKMLLEGVAACDPKIHPNAQLKLQQKIMKQKN